MPGRVGREHARARVALLIQHETRMRHIVLPFVASLARYFLINGMIFGKIYRTYNVCFYFLHKFYLKHFSFYEEFGDIL